MRRCVGLSEISGGVAILASYLVSGSRFGAYDATISIDLEPLRALSKTISLCRMSFALQKNTFLRIIARSSPKVGFRSKFTYVHPRQAPRTHSVAPRVTKRRYRLSSIQHSMLPESQFHINLVLIVLPHRLGNLQDTSLDSVGSRRRRSPTLPRTRHPETRGRRRRRRKKIVSTQCRHQT